MSDGRQRLVIEYTMVRTGAVVHAVKPMAGSLHCNGRFAASQTEAVYEPNIVTCLWCITGIDGSTLRWFKWGDGT